MSEPGDKKRFAGVEIPIDGPGFNEAGTITVYADFAASIHLKTITIDPTGECCRWAEHRRKTRRR